MADDTPTTDDVFGKPGSALYEAWMEYICAMGPQQRAKAYVRLFAIQQLEKTLRDPKRLVLISGI